MGVRLPAEYQEVEYLQTDGNQRIRTNAYINSNNIDVECKIAMMNGLKTMTRPILLAHGGGGNYFIPLGLLESSDHYQYFSSADGEREEWANIYNVSYNEPLTIRTVFDSVAHKRAAFVNGLKTEESSYNSDLVSGIGEKCNLWLFTWMTSPNVANTRSRVICKFYHLRYREDDVEKLDLIPCYRKSDDKPGMYDLVTKQFFTNAGTGEFVVGPDVIDSISPWLVARRRMLMQQEPELYPVGTDVIALYAQNWVNDSSWTNTGGTSSISGASRCTDFIPINPKYTYRKNGHRLYNYCCWYDKNKHFIRAFSQNNTVAQDITNIPENARYMRISTYKSSKEDLKVIRIA